jgi:hypothetical protein
MKIPAKDTGVFLVLPAEKRKSLGGDKLIIVQMPGQFTVDAVFVNLSTLRDNGFLELANGFIVFPIEKLEDIS